MDQQKILIKVENLSYKRKSHYILRNVNFEIIRGEFVIIVGPRGEGKSTLLKLLAGILPVEEGNVYYNGVNLNGIAKKDMIKIQCRTGFVFQNAALISNLKIFDNIALPLRYHDLYPEDEIQKKVEKLLKEAGLEEDKYLLPAFLSPGERKIAALLRAIVMEPETIFYDEPIANLDKPTRHLIIEMMKQQKERGVTSIVVSHLVSEFGKLVDKIIVLKNGTVQDIYTLDEVLKMGDEYIKNLIE